MPYDTLQEFLSALDAAGELRRIKAPVSNDGLATRFVQPPVTGFTVITRVSGVGSARPRASVTVKDTV